MAVLNRFHFPARTNRPITHTPAPSSALRQVARSAKHSLLRQSPSNTKPHTFLKTLPSSRCILFHTSSPLPSCLLPPPCPLIPASFSTSEKVHLFLGSHSHFPRTMHGSGTTQRSSVDPTPTRTFRLPAECSTSLKRDTHKLLSSCGVRSPSNSCNSMAQDSDSDSSVGEHHHPYAADNGSSWRDVDGDGHGAQGDAHRARSTTPSSQGDDDDYDHDDAVDCEDASQGGHSTEGDVFRNGDHIQTPYLAGEAPLRQGHGSSRTQVQRQMTPLQHQPAKRSHVGGVAPAQSKLAAGASDPKARRKHRLHKCTTCGRAFHRRNHLTRHMKMHSRTFDFECEHCGKKFYRRDQHMVHLRSHTGERPYACPHKECGKRFTQKGALNRHLKVHQANEDKLRQASVTAVAAEGMRRQPHPPTAPHQHGLAQGAMWPGHHGSVHPYQQYLPQQQQQPQEPTAMVSRHSGAASTSGYTPSGSGYALASFPLAPTTCTPGFTSMPVPMPMSVGQGMGSQGYPNHNGHGLSVPQTQHHQQQPQQQQPYTTMASGPGSHPYVPPGGAMTNTYPQLLTLQRALLSLLHHQQQQQQSQHPMPASNSFQEMTYGPPHSAAVTQAQQHALSALLGLNGSTTEYQQAGVQGGMSTPPPQRQQQHQQHQQQQQAPNSGTPPQRACVPTPTNNPGTIPLTTTISRGQASRSMPGQLQPQQLQVLLQLYQQRQQQPQQPQQ